MTKDSISFFVPGRAIPGGSKRAIVNKTTLRANVIDMGGVANTHWRNRIADESRKHHHGDPLTGPLDVVFHFLIMRPKGHFRTGRNSHMLRAHAPASPTGRPDVLKLARAAEDALTGILWRDDAQTVALVATKSYASKPGVHVRVRERDEGLNGDTL